MSKNPIKEWIESIRNTMVELVEKAQPGSGAKIRESIQADLAKPLTVAILGQTGVGKSSLLNALFGTRFMTDHIRPCTKEVQSVEQTIGLADRSVKVVFYDMPGIGESASADAAYLDMYLQRVSDCDVVLWAFPAGTRSFEFDLQALRTIVARQASADAKRSFINKLVLVLTKADNIVVGEPWTITEDRQDEFVAIPSKETLDVLRQQSGFAWNTLIEPFGEHVELRLPLPPKEPAARNEFQEGPLAVRDGCLLHQGILTLENARAYAEKRPALRESLTALHNMQMPVTCSARFRYGLNTVLMKAIVNAQGGASRRLQDLSDRMLLLIPPGEVSSLSNVRLASVLTSRIVALSPDLLKGKPQ